MNIIQRIVVLSMLAALPASAAVLTGSQQTVTRNLVVQGTAEASVSITPRRNILAGTASGNLILGTFEASTTAGTIAYRLNPTIVEQYPTPSYGSGYIKNSANANQKIEISLTPISCRNPSGDVSVNAALTGQWRVCPESSNTLTGTIVTHPSKVQNLVGGLYPIAIDAVAWTF